MNDSSCGIVAGIVGVILLVVVCCACLIAGIGVVAFFNISQDSFFEGPFDEFDFDVGPVTPTPRVIRPEREATPTPDDETETPGTAESGVETPVTVPSVIPTDTVVTLEEAVVPINDKIELASRLGGKADIPEVVAEQPVPLEVGAKDTFWVTDTDTNENYQVEATLQYVTDHLYFWVQDGVRFNANDLARLAETFENEIYPTNREFFGSEWSPGVDGDPHLYVLYAQRLGGSVAGYFSSADELHPEAHPYSNAHEMFMLSAEHVDLGDEFAYSVLAHEFQHMIHWYRDLNEESWLNEGFSELASFLNGYDVGGTDWLYTMNPDIQLNHWPNDPFNTGPHYGASFLFLTYFLDRFGDEATQSLVAAEDNGMDSIDNVLASIGAVDPESGEPLTADDIFSDWVIASYLQDETVEDGRYTYSIYPQAPQPSATESINSCPTDTETRDVSQYGVDYIRIRCRGDYTFRFEGSTLVNVLPEGPYSGDYAFWSNVGDESHMTLTRLFDFTDHTGPLTLNFFTWYDIEEDYDYLYLVASEDGENWQILTTPSGTDEDPSGNSYGWAYNGLSGGGPEWIEESVDISQFAGKQVYLSFEYVTDAAVNGEGFLIDDISIPEIGYFTDFEEDDGGWEAEGFVRIQNIMPQSYRISVITYGDIIEVDKYTLNGDNTLEIPLSLNGDTDEVVVAVSGVTRFTRQKTAYRFSINP